MVTLDDLMFVIVRLRAAHRPGLHQAHGNARVRQNGGDLESQAKDGTECNPRAS